jgi:myo-inositol-1(or 4)-monophosphatase
MHPTVNIATKAARAAGRIMIRYMGQFDRLAVAEKQAYDFVSNVDHEAEAEIIRLIRASYPSHAILAEETGSLPGDDSEWIIDPLDGTTNYLRGIPQFAVSIAFRHQGRLESAVVYDPIGDELFTASRGRGAHLNDRRLRVSGRSTLTGAILGTGFPFRRRELLESYLSSFRALMNECADIRRPGAASLDLAYVASGRFDGFWEFGLAPWDIAAGTLLVQEAGGLVGDFAGGHDFLKSGNVVAATPRVFKAILQRLHGSLPPSLLR